MTNGNIPLAYCNKDNAKILLDYIPNLEYNNTYEKHSTQFQKILRELFYHALATILRPLRILSNTGIYLYVNGNLMWFYPYLAFIIADWLEAYMMCGVYGSSNSLHLCHFCLVKCNMMNDVHIAKEDIHIHNKNDTKNALRYDKDKEILVYNIRNAL
ncbi:17253_t:CDS:1 [Funneliformis caledonium]|uniref:17253_t:CDS:1 n=1 Tax=Funneliformis caledonium TaxID=1117310 RepID=A0A9N9CBG3_9GLOM|nr:17253_t:CDS:1 [Funneliformis caledonium]